MNLTTKIHFLMNPGAEEKKNELVPPGRVEGVIVTPSTRSKSWVFTVNNYQSEDLVAVVALVHGSSVEQWIYGFEVGESGTPHIQGYVRFKYPARFSTLRNAVRRAHWEKAKGTSDQNYRYCSKEGDFQTNMEPKLTREDILNLVRAEYKDVQWRPWQQQVIDMIAEPADSRTVTWIVESLGNVGKSFLAKFLSLEPTTVICSGKASDVFNQVNATLEGGFLPKIVICDIPRTSLDYVSYTAIECLKNGLLYSGKYEGGKCIFPHPHVLCFANEKPKWTALSMDRWAVFKVQENALFKIVL